MKMTDEKTSNSIHLSVNHGEAAGTILCDPDAETSVAWFGVKHEPADVHGYKRSIQCLCYMIEQVK